MRSDAPAGQTDAANRRRSSIIMALELPSEQKRCIALRTRVR